ncbi:MAG TPA: beta-propeller fold lactonase family protein [Terriglobales bacterium]
MRLFLALIAFIGLLQTGCGKFFTNSKGGGGGGGNSTTTFVYAASSSGVFAFKADLTNGTLTTLSGSPSQTGPTPSVMVVDPKNRFLYVGTSTGINGFGINSDGTLNALSLTNTQVISPVGLAASANFLYAVDNSFNNLSAFTINSDGTVSPITNGTFQLSAVPSGLVIDPPAQHLYVALGTTGILTVNINSDGSLNPNTNNIVAPSSLAGTFTHLAITPNGKNLYATANGGVVAFSFDSNGIPTPLSSGAVVSTGGTNPAAAVVDSNSSFLYVTNQGSANVASFSITNSGLITPVTNSPFSTGSAPVGVAVSSNSNFVFVANSSGVQTFAVDSSTPGKLNAKATVNAGNNPAAIATLH